MLSGFRPRRHPARQQAGQAGSGRLRTVLVVLQFAVSIGLGIAALVVFAQISFARNIDLGFRKRQCRGHPARRQACRRRRATAFERTLRNQPGIVAVTASGYVPFDGNDSNSDVQFRADAQILSLVPVPIDPDYSQGLWHEAAGRRMLRTGRARSTNHQRAWSPTYSGGPSIS